MDVVSAVPPPTDRANSIPHRDRVFNCFQTVVQVNLVVTSQKRPSYASKLPRNGSENLVLAPDAWV